MLERAAVCFIFLHLSFFCSGQSFTAINYSISEGFPSSEIYKVYQDRNGFLWFATDNGVVRFDGKDIELYNVKDGLTDPVVFDFFEDGKGRLWFKTYSSKLSYYENGKIKTYPFNDKLTELNAIAKQFVYVSETKEMWFTSHNMLGKIDSLGRVTKEAVNDERGFFFRNINGTFLYGTASSENPVSTLSIDKKVYEVTFTAAGNLACWVQWQNKLYLSYARDLFEYDGKSLNKVFTSPYTIIDLSIADNHLWIGYLNHGVERFQRNDFKDSWSPTWLKQKSVTNVLKDHEGGLWFTTLEHGAFYVPNLLIRNYALETESKIRAVSSKGEFIFFGDQSGRMSIFRESDPGNIITKDFDDQILKCFKDSRNNIWMSSGGISWFDPVSGHKTNILDTSTGNDYCEDDQGYVWASSFNLLTKFDTAGKVIEHKKPLLFCRNICADDSYFFVGDRIGFHVLKKDLVPVSIPAVFSNLKTSDIIKLNDSTILISSIGSGFFLLNKKTWDYTQFSTQSNFIADNVYTVLIQDSLLWLGTEKGIAITSLKSILSHHTAFEYLTKKSGLVSDKVNFLVSGNHSLWAFSDEGFSKIPKTYNAFANKKPKFYLKRMLVNGEMADLSKKAEFSYQENNIQISFGYISFNNLNILTRYRLSPDVQWSQTFNTDMQFNALSPGTYTLELQSSADNIHWVPAYTFPPIVIQPPYWKTWYFQTSLAMLVLTIITVYFISQVKLYKRHHRKLIQAELHAIEQERSRIAKDLHDSVGTDFTAIKMVVTQLLNKYSEPKTSEVETQFQGTIQDIKTIIYGLSPPGLERYGLTAGLRNYVEKLNGTVPVDIKLNSFGPEIKDAKLGMTVFRIVQELISNSLKHSKADTISLHINSFADLLNILYEDNGTGFSMEGNHKGLGLYNIESRVQSVNGQLRFDSGAFGISYTIDIPLNKSTMD